MNMIIIMMLCRKDHIVHTVRFMAAIELALTAMMLQEVTLYGVIITKMDLFAYQMKIIHTCTWG